MYITLCKLFLYCCSVANSCPTLCDPVDCSMPGFPVLHFSCGVCSNSCPFHQWCYLTISSSVILSPPALNLSQHQGLFQWVGSSHQVTKVLELQFQHQSFQWIFRLMYIFIHMYTNMQASLVAQLVKNLPAIQEIWVWSLGWEDLLGKGKATHSSIVTYRIPWTV